MQPTSIILAAPRALRRIWRRSLLLRVSATTLALSALVVGVLGFMLLSRVTTGLLDARVTAAVSEASAGLGEARRLLDAADTGPTTPSASRLVDSVVSSLAIRAGSPGQFDVLLLSTHASTAPERGTNLVAVSSVPPALRSTVATSQRQAWTYTDIRYLDGGSAPGLVVGAPLIVPTVGAYELYYLFPLTGVQQTLDLVRGAVIVVGLLMVALLVVISNVVTRQVVRPVRQAAKTASRFSEGHLSERMKVRGEDDLAQLADSFNKMAASIARHIKELESLSRVQQRFVSDVSHELRTPLTTIRMAGDVLFEDRERFDAPTARAAELLQAQLDRFEALLADLLEISRFDAGAAVLDVEHVDMSTMLESLIDASAPLAERNGVEVRLQIIEPLPQVLADGRRVHRILRNLLDNAIEHADPTGVDVAVAANDTAVAITVRDLGVGLRPGESALVFNRFWRADPARARTTGGTGLGLAISLEDARLHGGWLEAWGNPGRGSCFRLTLPLRTQQPIEESPLPLRPDDQDEAARRDRQRKADVMTGRGPAAPEANGQTPAGGDEQATMGASS